MEDVENKRKNKNKLNKLMNEGKKSKVKSYLFIEEKSKTKYNGKWNKARVQNEIENNNWGIRTWLCNEQW